MYEEKENRKSKDIDGLSSKEEYFREACRENMQVLSKDATSSRVGNNLARNLTLTFHTPLLFPSTSHLRSKYAPLNRVLPDFIQRDT